MLRNLCIWIGGIALLAACATDVTAAFGRHFGWPVRGSIELVQAFILVAGSMSLVVATLAGSHACVHILVDRMGPASRLWIDRFSALLGLVFYAALLAGCLWIAADLWNAQEVSELLGLPYRLLRAFCNVALLLIAIAWIGKVRQVAPR